MTERKRKLNLIWNNKHRDYKSIIKGERYVLALRKGGTSLVPLDSLTDSEIDDEMKYVKTNPSKMKHKEFFTQIERFKVLNQAIRDIFKAKNQKAPQIWFDTVKLKDGRTKYLIKRKNSRGKSSVMFGTFKVKALKRYLDKNERAIIKAGKRLGFSINKKALIVVNKTGNNLDIIHRKNPYYRIYEKPENEEKYYPTNEVFKKKVNAMNFANLETIAGMGETYAFMKVKNQASKPPYRDNEKHLKRWAGVKDNPSKKKFKNGEKVYIIGAGELANSIGVIKFFNKNIGHYVVYSEKTDRDYFFTEKELKKIKTNPYSSKAKYRHFRVKSPSKFQKGSFRTIKLNPDEYGNTYYGKEAVDKAISDTERQIKFNTERKQAPEQVGSDRKNLMYMKNTDFKSAIKYIIKRGWKLSYHGRKELAPFKFMPVFFLQDKDGFRIGEEYYTPYNLIKEFTYGRKNVDKYVLNPDRQYNLKRTLSRFKGVKGKKAVIGRLKGSKRTTIQAVLIPKHNPSLFKGTPKFYIKINKEYEYKGNKIIIRDISVNRTGYTVIEYEVNSKPYSKETFYDFINVINRKDKTLGRYWGYALYDRKTFKMDNTTTMEQFFNDLLEIKNPSQLSIGRRVEREHKGTVNMIKRAVKRTGKIPPKGKIYGSIAREHLKEDKKYYSKLKKMEKKNAKRKYFYGNFTDTKGNELKLGDIVNVDMPYRAGQSSDTGKVFFIGNDIGIRYDKYGEIFYSQNEWNKEDSSKDIKLSKKNQAEKKARIIKIKKQLGVKNNPSKVSPKAKELFERFHQFKSTRTKQRDIPLEIVNGQLDVAEIGGLKEIVYTSNKYPDRNGKKKKFAYRHGFKKHAKIYADKNGRVLIIPLDKQAITERGFIYKH